MNSTSAPVKQEAGLTSRQLLAAIQEARTFFGIDPLYRIELRMNVGGAAQLDNREGYLQTWIEVNLDYYQTSPHLIREDMAHEVAHLIGAEVLAVQKRMEPEWQYGSKDARGGLLTDAIESQTVRLERLFIRERPGNPDGWPQ